MKSRYERREKEDFKSSVPCFTKEYEAESPQF